VNTHSLDAVYIPLKVTFGLVPLIAGIDKFTNLLTQWVAGVIEIVVGLAILTAFTRLGAFVAMGWLIAISVNLILAGYLDVAVRDLTMAVGAYSLGTIAGLKGLAWLPDFTPHAAEVGIHAHSTR
jgi:hypothetical protein